MSITSTVFGKVFIASFKYNFFQNYCQKTKKLLQKHIWKCTVNFWSAGLKILWNFLSLIKKSKHSCHFFILVWAWYFCSDGNRRSRELRHSPLLRQRLRDALCHPVVRGKDFLALVSYCGSLKSLYFTHLAIAGTFLKKWKKLGAGGRNHHVLKLCMQCTSPNIVFGCDVPH